MMVNCCFYAGMIPNQPVDEGIVKEELEDELLEQSLNVTTPIIAVLEVRLQHADSIYRLRIHGGCGFMAL
jgi:hypothetical protein